MTFKFILLWVILAILLGFMAFYFGFGVVYVLVFPFLVSVFSFIRLKSSSELLGSRRSEVMNQMWLFWVPFVCVMILPLIFEPFKFPQLSFFHVSLLDHNKYFLTWLLDSEIIGFLLPEYVENVGYKSVFMQQVGPDFDVLGGLYLLTYSLSIATAVAYVFFSVVFPFFSLRMGKTTSFSMIKQGARFVLLSGLVAFLFWNVDMGFSLEPQRQQVMQGQKGEVFVQSFRSWNGYTGHTMSDGLIFFNVRQLVQSICSIGVLAIVISYVIGWSGYRILKTGRVHYER